MNPAEWKINGTEIVTAVVGFVTAGATYFQGRKHGQGVFIKAVQDAAHIVIKDLRQECERLKGQHAECEVKLEAMQTQIDALMAANPPAAYHLGGTGRIE